MKYFRKQCWASLPDLPRPTVGSHKVTHVKKKTKQTKIQKSSEIKQYLS